VVDEDVGANADERRVEARVALGVGAALFDSSADVLASLVAAPGTSASDAPPADDTSPFAPALMP
jgi:hypothetical protein